MRFEGRPLRPTDPQGIGSRHGRSERVLGRETRKGVANLERTVRIAIEQLRCIQTRKAEPLASEEEFAPLALDKVIWGRRHVVSILFSANTSWAHLCSQYASRRVRTKPSSAAYELVASVQPQSQRRVRRCERPSKRRRPSAAAAGVPECWWFAVDVRSSVRDDVKGRCKGVAPQPRRRERRQGKVAMQLKKRRASYSKGAR